MLLTVAFSSESREVTSLNKVFGEEAFSSFLSCVTWLISIFLSLSALCGSNHHAHDRALACKMLTCHSPESCFWSSCSRLNASVRWVFRAFFRMSIWELSLSPMHSVVDVDRWTRGNEKFDKSSQYLAFGVLLYISLLK